ncbi:DUF3644 domain-containing protein [Micromonospora carbonacea]|uniref:DUF3644 domain-containing protein n=1 Tax=Micromonospora carbonacea TaxID=47853 RepID=A0A7H8XFI4_9ACTN|nr:DUF3644 domain-containing protein [Micromonospora carbonacea]MBB5828622.1 hypothetical protein [Micromonospora carbonacea]QLD23796.1 DUF3644 domain-containing protein [Micromonospora carbonacea]
MAYARWRHILTESQRHALKAVDEWNCSSGNYCDFLTHMHKAWHYLLHAEFHQAKIDYHYKDAQTGEYKLIDGEPKAWDLEFCLKQRYPNSSDPVRLNAELFVALRNKVEHRYEHNAKVATGGKAQALVMNYEHEMVSHFGGTFSLAERLRFPVSLQSLTAEGREQLRAAAAKLPKGTRDLVARFEAAIDPAVLDDLKYDYRVRLVPVVGSKSDADLAIDFVKLDDLSEDERKVMMEAGRQGTVIIKNRHVEVADKDKLLPSRVACLVESQLPFEFNVQREHTEMWRRLAVRPTAGASDPCDTDARYCVYNEAFKSYAYTPAWVKRIVKEIGTVEKYRAFFGREPRMKKATSLPRQEGPTSSSLHDAQPMRETA